MLDTDSNEQSNLYMNQAKRKIRHKSPGTQIVRAFSDGLVGFLYFDIERISYWKFRSLPASRVWAVSMKIMAIIESRYDYSLK